MHLGPPLPPSRWTQDSDSQELKVPTHISPSIIVFGCLVLFLNAAAALFTARRSPSKPAPASPAVDPSARDQFSDLSDYIRESEQWINVEGPGIPAVSAVEPGVLVSTEK